MLPYDFNSLELPLVKCKDAGCRRKKSDETATN